jgi:hypothetical protein
LLQDRVVKIGDLDRGLTRTVLRAFEEVNGARRAVVDTPEVWSITDGPIEGVGLHAERAFDFVHQLQRMQRRPIDLVDEGEDRRVLLTTDLEELQGLRLDPAGTIEDHDGAVHRGQRAIGVFGKVLVTGGVEQVQLIAVVGKGHHG